jgi:hypothetical protein
MTSKDNYITLKEAAKVTNKSVRTLRRYLDKVDIVDKDKWTKKESNRIFVNSDFIDFVTVGKVKLSTNDKDQKEETSKKDKDQKEEIIQILKEKTEDQKGLIQKLESRNNELFEMVKDKDRALKNKDEDFKLLTSKVISLQDEIKQIGPAKDKTEPEQPEPKRKLNNTLLLFILLCLIAGIVLLVVFISK